MTSAAGDLANRLLLNQYVPRAVTLSFRSARTTRLCGTGLTGRIDISNFFSTAVHIERTFRLTVGIAGTPRFCAW